MPLSKLHHISLGGGKFKDTTYKDLKTLFEAVQAPENESKPLVVHFHGGLVSPKGAFERATGEDGEGPGLMDYYGEETGYPLFFVWESDLKNILFNNLTEIASEPVFKKLLKKVSQFVMAKIKQEPGSRGTMLELDPIYEISQELDKTEQGELPFSDMQVGDLGELDKGEERQFEDALKNDPRMQKEFEAIANGMMDEDEVDEAELSRSGRLQISKSTLMTPALMTEIREEAKNSEQTRGLISTLKLVKAGVVVLKRIITRLIQKTDHGIYPTIMEELLREFYLANAGKFVWDLIKQDTIDAFGEDENAHGGTSFLMKLKAAHEAGDRRKIVLVGHSTGAIYICHLLKNADKLGLPADIKFDVIFLAAATTCTLFAETVRNHADRIANFRNFAMSDELEAKDKLLSFIYPRSLLYIVSGILEGNVDEPLIGMERYFTGKAPYEHSKNPDIKTCADYFDAIPDSLLFSDVDKGDGKRCFAHSHVDFNTDAPTMESVQHLIKHGF